MAQLSDYQRDVLIRTALGEARGEGVEGMADVLQVIFNRANSGKYPSDPAKVALQKNNRTGIHAFSAWNNENQGGNRPQQFSKGSDLYKTAERALDMVVSGERPDYTGGALFYHTPAVNPYWADEANTHGTIQRNGHIFYPSRPTPPGEIPNVVASRTDTTPPQQITGKSNAPTSAASRQAPTNWFTPRLAPGNDQAYVYQIPDQTNASLEGGYGSLTPSIGQRPPIPMPRPRPGMPVVPYDRGETIATVPTPQRQRLPELPPAGTSRMADVPLPRPRPVTASDVASVPYGQGQRVASIPTSGVGQPPATRSVPSVPVRTAQAGPMDGIGSMPSFAGFSSTFAPPPPPVPTTAVPGPNAMPKGDERLVAGIYPSVAGHGLPPAVPDVGVASAMSVIPGFPPMPRNRPLRSGVNVQMPTPMGQRPTLPMPRANPNALRVTVQGAGSYSAPQRAPTPTREQMLAAIRARSRGPTAFGHGGTIDGAVQPIGTLSGRR